jgi:hypothetical protein
MFGVLASFKLGWMSTYDAQILVLCLIYLNQLKIFNFRAAEHFCAKVHYIIPNNIINNRFRTVVQCIDCI